MLIVGLGNPGKEYENTRHNVGYIFADRLAEGFKASFKLSKKHQGYLAKFKYNGVEHYILKPITYMNLSGISVQSVMNYYHLTPKDILVISDDLDLPTGKIRIREKGSTGGHRGLKSIFECVGTDEILRIKIGISSSDQIDTKDYVLGHLKGSDLEHIEKATSLAPNLFSDLCDHDLVYVMNKYNGDPQ